MVWRKKYLKSLKFFLARTDLTPKSRLTIMEIAKGRGFDSKIKKIVRQLPQIYFSEADNRFYSRESDFFQGREKSPNFIYIRRHTLRLMLLGSFGVDRGILRHLIFFITMNNRVSEARTDRNLPPGVHVISLRPVLITEREVELWDMRKKYEAVRGNSSMEWIAKYRNPINGTWMIVPETFASPYRARIAAKEARTNYIL